MNAALSCQLDAEALARLSELDPTGQNRLLKRLLVTFEKSLDRLVPQLEQARDAADARAMHLVAHTLKSSSAALGAMVLSRQCAVVEDLARQNRLTEAAGSVQQMLLEAAAAREAVRGLAAQLEMPASAA
jgi:HPt (histidine-containing phosphotransfer) domain-containing protein